MTEQGSDLKEEKSLKPRRRAAPWLFGGLTLLLLTVLVSLQLFGLWEIFTPDTARDTLLIYALSTLNFVAFFLFSFIFILRHFTVRPPLLDEAATFDNVVREIKDAAGQLDADDIFLFTFSGHGTRVQDGELEELDGQDEALVLYDYLLLDDVLRRGLWPLFKPGVRVLVVADSCHSGTVTQVPPDLVSVGVAESLTSLQAGETVGDEGFFNVSQGGPPRSISVGARLRHIEQNRDFYHDILSALPENDPIDATILLLAACEDFDTTRDGPDDGAFTKALLEVWNGGTFNGDYEEFRAAIQQRPPLASRSQVPQLLPTGATLSPEFRFTKPIFTI